VHLKGEGGSRKGVREREKKKSDFCLEREGSRKNERKMCFVLYTPLKGKFQFCPFLPSSNAPLIDKKA
jgi:hypothetical protein